MSTKKAGRPRKADGERPLQRSVRMRPKMWEQIEHIASELGMSQSQVVEGFCAAAILMRKQGDFVAAGERALMIALGKEAADAQRPD